MKKYSQSQRSFPSPSLFPNRHLSLIGLRNWLREKPTWSGKLSSALRMTSFWRWSNIKKLFLREMNKTSHLPKNNHQLLRKQWSSSLEITNKSVTRKLRNLQLRFVANSVKITLWHTLLQHTKQRLNPKRKEVVIKHINLMTSKSFCMQKRHRIKKTAI